MGSWDDLCEGGLWEKIYVICWGLGSERKGKLQQVVCYRAGMRLGVVLGGAEEGEVKVWSQPTYFPGRSGMWVHREGLLELGPNFFLSTFAIGV